MQTRGQRLVTKAISGVEKTIAQLEKGIEACFDEATLASEQKAELERRINDLGATTTKANNAVKGFRAILDGRVG